mgnify:FL=1
MAELIKSPIKSYTKSELARLYNPELCYQSAMRTFRQWLKMNRELNARLSETGYSPLQHTFTPKQVELIFHFLGYP